MQPISTRILSSAEYCLRVARHQKRVAFNAGLLRQTEVRLSRDSQSPLPGMCGQSYCVERWGFCMSQNQLDGLQPGPAQHFGNRAAALQRFDIAFASPAVDMAAQDKAISISSRCNRARRPDYNVWLSQSEVLRCRSDISWCALLIAADFRRSSVSCVPAPSKSSLTTPSLAVSSATGRCAHPSFESRR